MTPELEQWRELADPTKLGWPEWEDYTAKFRLRAISTAGRLSVDVLWYADLKWTQYHLVSNHEAACLFERHARTWLWEKHGIHLGRLQGKVLVGTKTGILCTDGKIKNWLPLEHESVAQFDEPVAALQAAVRTAGKEGKGSPCKQ